MPAAQKTIQVECSSEQLNGSRTNHVRAALDARPVDLWWQFSGDRVPQAPNTGNHALTALLPWAMHHGVNLHIRASVDQTLLENAEESIDAWSLWRPDLYRRIQVTADQSCSSLAQAPSSAALMYSGGVDANYSLLAHQLKLLGQRTRSIGAAVLVHGFDIPLADDAWFLTAKQHAALLLQEFDCPLVQVRTNWRSICTDWEMEFGFGVATVLHQLDHDFGCGLWSADLPYNHELIPWGNNSISNPLLSGANFHIRSVGAGINRVEKLRLICQYPAVREHLRVCWRKPHNGLNCGTCEKCVRTRLTLMAFGYDAAGAFEGTLSLDTVRQVGLSSRAQSELLDDVLRIPDSRIPPDLLRALQERTAHYKSKRPRGLLHRLFGRA